MNKSKFMKKISALFDEMERDCHKGCNSMHSLNAKEKKIINDAYHEARQMAHDRGIPWARACDLTMAEFRKCGAIDE